MRHVGEQQRVAVGRGFGGDLGAQAAAGAGAVVDDDLLAERFSQPLADQAGEHVGAAAGRVGHDHADGSIGIRLRRRRGAGEGGESEKGGEDELCRHANSVAHRYLWSTAIKKHSFWQARSRAAQRRPGLRGGHRRCCGAVASARQSLCVKAVSRGPFFHAPKMPRLRQPPLTERADAAVRVPTGANRAVGGFFTTTDPLPANHSHAPLRRCREVNMALRPVLLSTVAAIGFAAMAVAAPAPAVAQQATVAIDKDDIGGVVTGPNGPEAGVWVIAETTELPTKYAKTVVTDDQGRYVVPDLPAANYQVWVRGYGLVD